MTATHPLWHHGGPGPPSGRPPLPRLLCPDRGGGPAGVDASAGERTTPPRVCPSFSTCPSTYLLTRVRPGQGPPATGSVLVPLLPQAGPRGSPTASVWTAPMSPRWSPGQPPPSPFIGGALWLRNGPSGLGPQPTSRLRAHRLADPNLPPFRDPLETSSVVRPLLLGEASPGPQPPSSRATLGFDRWMDRRSDCQLWVESWFHVSRLAQLVGVSPCLCAELPCHAPCVEARGPAAPLPGNPLSLKP